MKNLIEKLTLYEIGLFMEARKKQGVRLSIDQLEHLVLINNKLNIDKISKRR